ncbi:MAG: hypothetical protein HC831_18490 [Chloroflexia bacterium]|nr:hypothetical protein [Chloroflexia bacterium]
MNEAELVDLIRSTEKSKLGGLGIKISNRKEWKELLIGLTSFLPLDFANATRIFYIRNNVQSPILCAYPECKRIIKFPQYKKKYCSHRCASKHIQNDDIFKEKLTAKKKKFWKDADEDFKSGWKNNCKNGMMAKYGVDHNFKLEDHYERSKKTLLKRYGVDSPAKSHIIKDKIRNTNIEKYGVSCPLNAPEQIIKKKETWMKNLGVDNPLKSEVIKKKIRDTHKEKYGMHPSKLPEIKKKQFNTWIKNRAEGKHHIWKRKIFTFPSGRQMILQETRKLYWRII